MKRAAAAFSLVLISISSAGWVRAQTSGTIPAATPLPAPSVPLTQLDTSTCHAVAHYQECELPLKNSRGEIVSPPGASVAMPTIPTIDAPLALHPLQSVRLMFESSTLSFTRIVIVLHGCNPGSGWSKITTDQFLGLKPGTLYVIPFSSTAYGSCSEGTTEYFRRVPIENFVSQLGGMIQIGQTPQGQPQTDQLTNLSSLPLTVAAHSAGQKPVVQVAANSARVERYLLLDAAYTQGYFTRDFDVLFAKFMTAQASHTVCAFDTADVDGLPGQTPKYGCQQYCTATAPCLGTWSTSAGHMGVLFLGLGALTQ